MSEAVAPTPAEQATSLPLSRREFLYYLWGISIAVFLAGSGGATVWFSLPRFREGEFGGVFTIPVEQIPAPDTPPQEFPAGRFWLVNVGHQTLDDPRQPADYPEEAGVKALYKVCVHLGCLYKWVDTNDRFECPCHGSKYLKSGTRVDGPARRNLDVFIIEAIDSSGTVLGRTEPQMNSLEGTAVAPPSGTVSLKIDTGRLVRGAPNSKPGGGM